MRRKLLSVILSISAILSVSCTKDETKADITSNGDYKGKLTVKLGEETKFTKDDVTFNVQIDEANQEFDILMQSVNFSEHMPLALDIQLINLHFLPLRLFLL